MRRMNWLPLTVRVPLLVAGLMIVLGAIASERVLARLAEMQQRQLRELAAIYFDGLSVAVLPAALRDDVWEAFDALDRATEGGRSLAARITTLATGDGEVLASSDPLRFPTGSAVGAPLADAPLPEALTLGSTPTVQVRAPLAYQGRIVGQLHAEFDVAALLAARRATMLYLLVANAAATVLLALAGYLMVRRMLRPVGALSAHMGRAGGPEVIPADEIPVGANEFGRLFHQYNALVRAERARRADAQRMADHAQLVSLGRLASGIAHEINNPLGGLLNAVDTLKLHGDKPAVAASSFALIERGLLHIRDVVHAMLETYRPEVPLVLLSAADFDDLRLLVGAELRRQSQQLDWSVDPEALSSLGIPSAPVRQAVLNLLLNASRAAGRDGRIRLTVIRTTEGFAITAANDGRPLPDDARRLLETGDPVAASDRVGLRVVVDAVRRLGGMIRVEKDATGTAITVAIPSAAAPQERAA